MYFCSMNSIYREIKDLLTEGGMPEGEARAVALMLLEKVAGLPTAKALIADGNDLLCRRQTLLELAARLSWRLVWHKVNPSNMSWGKQIFVV